MNKRLQKIKSRIPKGLRKKAFQLYLRLAKKSRRISCWVAYNFYWRFYLALNNLNQTKEISAMMRVKNEEEFLYQAVESIADVMDEIIIVDNNSTDRTPEIIKKLKKEYPGKVKNFIYKHRIEQIGEASKNLILKNKNSPNHLMNYYNWCLSKCTKPYVAKWDGHMIATSNFRDSIRNFKKSRHLFISNVGLNIHPDCRFFVKTIRTQRALENGLFELGLKSYLSAQTDREIRVFPHLHSAYDAHFPYWENYTNRLAKYPQLVYRFNKIAFLHMKYCKKEPFENIPTEMKKIILTHLRRGRPVTGDLFKIVQNVIPQSINDRVNQKR